MAKGYIKPGVLVLQEIRSASPAILMPDQKACIVGPAYQIEKNVFVDDFVPGNQYSVPKLIEGAEIVESSGTIKFAEKPVLTINNVSLTRGQDYYEDTSVDFINSGIQPGMVFVLGTFKTTISSVEQNKITFSDSVPNDIAGNAEVREVIPEVQAVINFDATTAKITVTPSISNIKAGKIFIDYKAVRKDLTHKMLIFNSVTEVIDQLGPAVPENKLSYALVKALSNTTVSVLAFPTAGDDADDYGAALQQLAAEDVYFIVPLTNNPAVISMLPAHLDSLSKPEVKKWRMAIVAPNIPTEMKITDGIAETISDGVITDFEAKFTQTIGTSTDYSYYVKINGQYHKISSVLNNNKIKLSTPYPADGTNVPYEVYLKAETKADKLKLIKSNTSGLKNRRLVALFPHVVIDDNGQEVPSYYLAAALAGMLSGLPSHKPATFMGIGGFLRVPYADLSYFTDSELNEIAGAGYLIVTQDSRTAPLYIRHQITTDDTSDYTREISATRTIDYLSVVFEESIKPFIGRFNLIDEVVEMIKETLKAQAKILMSLKTAFIGAPLLDFQLGTVEKLTATTLSIEAKVQIPMPLNYIILRLVV